METFVLYTSYARKMQRLSMAQRGVLFTAILAHEAGEELPKMDGETATAFDFIRYDLDENRSKYERKCARNKQIADEREERKRSETNVHERARTCTNGTYSKSKSDSKSNKDKEKERGTHPTLEEVKAYCQDHGPHVNPEAFMAHYEANGWKVGKNPMKDWKACVRGWETREKDRQKIQPVRPRFSHEDRHTYDFDQLASVLSRPVGGSL